MIELIARPRRGGKTTELIRMSALNDGYIVCANSRRAAEVTRRASELGLRIPEPITAEEWAQREYYPAGVQRLYFDDLDQIVQAISAVPVGAATWTTER